MLCGALSAQVVLSGGVNISGGTQVSLSCGPPSYSCSTQTAALINAPSVPTSLIGYSGSSASPAADSTLSPNSTIVRCTDGNFGGSSLLGFSFFSGVGDSAEANIISSDDVLAQVGDSGGAYMPVAFLGFNTSSGLACARLYPNLYSSSGGLRLGQGEFSAANSRWLYARPNTSLTLANALVNLYNLTGYNIPSISSPTSAPTTTTIINWAHAMPSGWLASGSNGGNLSYEEFVGCSNENTHQMICAADFSNNTGGQGTGYLVLYAIVDYLALQGGTFAETNNTYYAADLNCNMAGGGATCAYEFTYNSGTSSWTQTSLGSLSNSDSSTGFPAIHNLRLNRNGNILQITPSGSCNGTCSASGGHYYLYSAISGYVGAGTNLNPAPSASGHECQGWAYEVNQNAANMTKYISVNTTITLPPSLSYCGGSYPNLTGVPCFLAPVDKHLSCSNADQSNGLDNYAVSVGTTTQPTPPYTSANTTQPDPGIEAAISVGNSATGIGPYRDELYVLTLSNLLIHRQTHIWSSAGATTSGGNNNNIYNVCVLSTDGIMAECSMDMLGQLGTSSGTTCIAATQYWRPNWTYGANVNVAFLSHTANAGYYIANSGTGGTSGSSMPTVAQSIGGTFTDGTINSPTGWTSQGTYNCRTDIFFIKMQ